MHDIFAVYVTATQTGNAGAKQDKQTFFYRDEQDIQDKNKIVFRLYKKPLILFILSIPVNFVFEGFVVIYFAKSNE
jgi:hypothetical protein